MQMAGAAMSTQRACPQAQLLLPVSRSRNSHVRISVRASAGAESTVNNILGQAIKQTYGIGKAETIRWGVLKKEVVPPQQVRAAVAAVQVAVSP